MATHNQTAANRRNAQKSTGPRTPQGRAASSLNALKHGLTARHLVLRTETQRDFDVTLRAFQADLQPLGPTETALFHQLVAAHWRLVRARQVQTEILDYQISKFSDPSFHHHWFPTRS